MKRALVLAYYFPPHGGAGVQRTAKFLKHLGSFGYEPVVVTGPTSTALDWAPRDDTLAADLSPFVEARIGTPEPAWSSGWRGRLEGWLRIDSRFATWWIEEAEAVGRELAADVDVIYASMSPFETAEAAARIAAASGKPWVADLRDPWALDDWTVYPTRLHRSLDERKMQRWLTRADAVILNSEEATLSVLARFPELRARHVTTIPNGWDSDDFRGAPPLRDDDAFRIVYVGYAHVEGGRRGRGAAIARRVLGGKVSGLDAQARSHLYLLQAVDAVVAGQPDAAKTIEVHLAGAQDVPDERTALHPLVRDHRYLPHDEAVALMRSADLLFLPMQDLAPGLRTRTVPGKTYEYLAARRPILGALPDGDARDLLAGIPGVHVCRPKDIDCMASAIRRGLEQPRPISDLEFPDGLLESFERRELTRRLASVFDAVLARQPAVDPASV